MSITRTGLTGLIGVLVMGLLLSSVPGCSGSKGRIREVDPERLGVAPILRGTVGAETKIRRALPTIISGYGLVVGLDGTGGTTVPERVAATMERELAIRGVGSPGAFQGTLLEGRSPQDVLRDPDVAVVIVEAAVPLASPESMVFDVRVRALAGSTTTSLEGGTLWTTKLQAGPPAVVGGPQTREVAEAVGDLFINPFALVETGGSGDTDPRVGRVLGGGRMTKPLSLELILANPLHSRARAIARSINQRFPNGPGGIGTTARGVSDGVVEVTVPLEFRDRFYDFIELVRHLPINPDFPEENARRYVRALQSGSELTDELSWALRALGEPATPFVRDLYEDDDPAVRLAGLRAGAFLNDPRSGLFLREIASDPRAPDRVEAIRLLGVVDGRPTIDETLRRVISSERSLDVRTAAYEALAERAVRGQLAKLLRWRQSTGEEISERELARLAERRIPPGLVQGIMRFAPTDRFVIDVIPFGEPLIYVTQQGGPRVAIFGESPALKTPAFLSIWDGELLVVAESETNELRVRFRDPASDWIVQERVPNSLVRLTEFMAREQTPERPDPGLRMTYSDMVGALFAIQTEEATDAAFATEGDRLLAGLLRAAAADADRAREEASAEELAAIRGEGEQIDAFDPSSERQPATGSRYVVPINRSDETRGSR